MKIPPISIKPDPGANLLKRIRGLMASEEGVQERLDRFVKIISSAMKANVCSIYLRAGDELELCATKGLKQSAVHTTRLGINQGLVGNVARRARVLNLAEAADHEDFLFKPETGEQRFHSFLGVPLLRGGRNLGVLVVQGKRARIYSEAEVESLLTAATLLAEIAVADERAGGKKARLKGIHLTPTGPETISGQAFASGLVQGRAVLHLPPVASGAMIAARPAEEQIRLERAIRQMRRSVDAMVDGVNGQGENGQGENGHGAKLGVAMGAASKEIFESYRLFAYDRKWLASLRDAVNAGLTAEAAVERVRNEHRARMQKARDPYLRARLHDLEDLANRMLRTLGGENVAPGQRQLPDNAVVFARNLGPAEVLDYDRDKLRGIVLEEGSATAHATIICRTLGIPLVGLAERVLDRIEADDQVLVDGELGEVHIRPTPEDIDAFLVRVGIRAKLDTAFEQQRDLPAITKDGQHISLLLNAGLLVDLPGLDSAGADGIGLFRTEFQFMVSQSMPRLGEQVDLYKRALGAAQKGKRKRPVTFRTLDLGGDKILPYAVPMPEENPAIGWRAIRIGLDRPGMLRYQLRALLLAGAGQNLRIMFPMVATVSEFEMARALLDKERERIQKMGGQTPAKLEVGVMLETPALAWQIDAICKHVDFVSVGANDLMQFFFAADRDNPRVAGRYDGLHPAALSILSHIADRCKAANTQLTVCGEMAGRPLEAICLTALGYRNLSMPVTGIGPVKSALLALDAGKLAALIKPKITSATDTDTLREDVLNFCEQERIPV